MNWKIANADHRVDAPSKSEGRAKFKALLGIKPTYKDNGDKLRPRLPKSMIVIKD